MTLLPAAPPARSPSCPQLPLPADPPVAATSAATAAPAVTTPASAAPAAVTHPTQRSSTKDNLIVYSWNKITEWIYVVLSRVKTLEGLFLVRPLKLTDIKPPSKEYLSFLQRMKDMQTTELEQFRNT